MNRCPTVPFSNQLEILGNKDWEKRDGEDDGKETYLWLLRYLL